MANYTNLIARITAAIADNTEQAITGDVLQGEMLAMVSTLGGYQYGGVVNPESEFTPGDANVFFLAYEAGTYSNLDESIVLDGKGLYVITYNGSYKATLAMAVDLSDYVTETALEAAIADFITRSVNDLANYYLKSETYTKKEVTELIGAIQQFHYEIYASLGDVTSPASNVLYLIGPSGSGPDLYEEYVYANSTFTKIGDTSIDLSDYYTASDVDDLLDEKEDAANKVTALSASSTDDEYPSAKCVYDIIGDVETLLAAI